MGGRSHAAGSGSRVWAALVRGHAEAAGSSTPSAAHTASPWGGGRPLACGDYLRATASPADTTRAVVVVPGKNQRQLPAEVTVTVVLSCPVLPVLTVLTVL